MSAPSPTAAELPYWDSYLRQLGEAPEIENFQALHSHYGCWDNPAWSNRVPDDYGRAAERMCEKVLTAAGIEDGQCVLDVGCGLGSVLASLNQRRSRMSLVGLNIDARQLAIAHNVCHERGDGTAGCAVGSAMEGDTVAGNTVRWVAGDAVRLPLAEGAFDVVLALECSMHFPSRAMFLSEAHRVLRPGGRLALCEHFAKRARREPIDQPRRSRLWGTFQEPLSQCQFQELAAAAGFMPTHDEDVTRNTLPTFPGVRRFVAGGLPWPLSWQARAMLRLTELLVRAGRLEYRVLAFQRG